MKDYNIYFTQVASIILIFSCSISGQSRQEEIPNPLLVDEGFESGTLSSSLNPSGNSPEIVKVSDAREGNYVMKSEINDSSETAYRTEISVSKKIVNFDVGKEYWVGISIKLGEEFGDSIDWHDGGMICQWHYRSWLHPEVKGAQPLVLRYTGQVRDYQPKRQVGVQNELYPDYLAYADPDYNKWVDWVFHIKFDDVDGIYEIWRNGEQIVDFIGDNHMVEMIEGAYMKFGIYATTYKTYRPESFRRVVYHDALRIADSTGSYELVAPFNKILDIRK